jgi:hypothetical protein
MLLGMEPKLETAPELTNILAELSRLEPIFHWPPRDISRAALEKMTVDDFWETGASGRRFARDFVFNVLEQRQAKSEPDVWQTSEFYCCKLAEDVFLLTYTFLQDKARLTRRATIWHWAADGWTIVYHQGTVVQDAS